LVDGDNKLATAVLSTAGELTTDAAATDDAIHSEVTSELTYGNDNSAPVALSTTPLAAVTELSTEVVDGDSDVATDVLSAAEKFTTGMSANVTVLILDLVTVLATLTEVTSELVHGNDDLATGVLHSAAHGSGVGIPVFCDNISDTAAEMLLSVSLSVYGISETDA